MNHVVIILETGLRAPGPASMGNSEVSEESIGWHPVTTRMANRLRRFGLRHDDRRRTMTLSVSFVFEGGPLHADRLSAAFARVSERHAALRTRFRLVEDGEPQQSVVPPHRVAVPLEVVRCRPLDAGEPTAEALGHLQRERETAFDLGSGALLRGQLITDSEHSHIVTVSADHIVSDGVSTDLLVADLVAAYRDPEGFDSADSGRTLVEFAEYQRGLMDTGRGKRLLDEWIELLPQGVPEMVLPRDFHPSETTNDGGQLSTVLGRKAYAAMREQMRELRASPFVLAGAGLLAEARRSGVAGALSFLTPCAGRPVEGYENTVGNFTNVLPLVVAPPESEDFALLVQRVRSAGAWLLDHQEVPFATIVGAVDPAGSTMPHERSQIFLSHQALHVPVLEGMTGVEVQPAQVDALFDVSIWLTDLGNRLQIDLVYRRRLFEKSTAERVLAAVVRALTGGR
ncbi:condensation domain-containing protein [Kitasatospora cineracea]|uniref:condensation domain-containing protein n=1 Tax=Kitasatospora cineracea TaxID=88074 RepID=UPI003409FB9B